MDKKLMPKIIFIIVIVVLAIWMLYPPNKTLKPGMDLGGGTSLIYEIDTQGLEASEKKGLSEKMITVLRRRIDPANIQNLIWRPQGSTRFEIQMPLASKDARIKRQNFEEALTDLLADNINVATIMRSLGKPLEERTNELEQFSRKSPERLEILNTLATAYDELQELRGKRDSLAAELQTQEQQLSESKLDVNQIKINVGNWSTLEEQQLTKTLTEFVGSEDKLELLSSYVNTYRQWAEVVDQLTNPETGKNVQYINAKNALDQLNLSEDQVTFVLEMGGEKSVKRARAIQELEAKFPQRTEKIEKVVAAYDEYQPFKGRLDDPKDLQRMLKGAGILEFRILPTLEHPQEDTDELLRYVERLKSKGPKYASDNKYVWCEIENATEWQTINEQGRPVTLLKDHQGRPAVVSQFGDKSYVLASNKQNECMLHTTAGKDWRLIKAQPGTDPRTGGRAIDFLLDEKGGGLFGNVTSKNIDRPLCILLDGSAISAPVINSTIYTRGQISGHFSETEVEDMVNKLNAGSLPARLIEQPISIKTIGPSIGADNRDKGIKAGFIGLILVVACMLIYYTLAGSIADVALLMNLLIVLAIMAGVRATFTMPGIAGIILTIGMSVDANVLIFERIREEQMRGSSLRLAIQNGYQRAFRTILDANLTTLITAAILFWVASEEVKGFAIVIMLGIGSSMFTALFVTRVVFDWLLARRIIKEHLTMLSIIHNPNVNWMAMRPIFLCVSVLLVAGGLFVFFTRDDVKNNKYDIEFTGGTSIQINLAEKVNLTRQQVEDRIHKAGADMGNPALQAANVYSIGKTGKQYEINTTETNKLTAKVNFGQGHNQTVASVTSAIEKAETELGGRLTNLYVTQDSGKADTFVITTGQLNKTFVQEVLSTAFADAVISEPEIDEVVNDAIHTAFADDLEIQQNLEPKIISTEKITEELIGSYPELVEFVGGIKITCETEKAVTLAQMDQRLKDLRFKPDMQNLTWYSYKLLGPKLAEPNEPLTTFVFLSVDPEAGYRELSEDEWARFVENETKRVLPAAQLETSLPRVTQINPSVGAEAKTRAMIAIILSLFAIVAYIWIRFGNVRYGVAAIVALVHDVCITLGAVTACTYIAATPIGEKLLIGNFKIDLAMIAALLTLIGYSLNDTIVVFDRIRENRKKANLSPQIITDSINQTMSRTLMTSFTTFIVVLVMYIFGGAGLRGFTFAIGFGIIIGTYSSIAIAAPILLLGKSGTAKTKKADSADRKY